MSHKRLSDSGEASQGEELFGDPPKPQQARGDPPPSGLCTEDGSSVAYAFGVSSTACSSSSSSSSSISSVSPRLGLDSPFQGFAGDVRSPACLFADTPAVSPRVSAAEIRLEEERSERQVNSSRRQFMQHEPTPADAGARVRRDTQQTARERAGDTSGDTQEPMHTPVYCRSTREGEGCAERWIAQLLRAEPLSADEIRCLCNTLKQILIKEPNCLSVSSPVTVAGDIHGQFYDLLELFRVGGMPPHVNYLFLGDYVDRGFYSVEVFCLIAALKIRYPYSMAVLRGNHESRSITEVYGFYDECLRKYGPEARVWEVMTETFDLLPLAACVDGSYFCTHGGLSRELKTVDAIQTINRCQEPPPEGGMSELLWSDPYDCSFQETGGEASLQGDRDPEGLQTAAAAAAATASASALDDEGWAPSSRGAGLLWGKDVTDRFLHLNNMQCVCRAHQLVSDGYQWSHDSKVVTVFSAPNYCYRCGNKASLMVLDETGGRRFLSFRHAPERGDPEVVRTLPGYFI